MRVKVIHGVFFRYILNGCIATIFHYIVLSFSIEFLELHSAGVANLISSFFAINFSYVGNRYFVFRSTSEPNFKQYCKFLYLYVRKKGSLVVLQSNNYHKIEEHINCKNSLNEFIADYNFDKILYTGTLKLDTFERYMIIAM